MAIEWKELELEDMKLLKPYYDEIDYRFNEASFANNLLWTPYFHMRYAIVERKLVFRSNEEARHSVSYPFGKKPLKGTIDRLMEDFIERGKKFRMHLVTEDEFEVLSTLYPGMFQIEYDRDSADYLYESQKLITLAGKKLHSKRNFINRFKTEHPDWQYEVITEENKTECFEMAKNWGMQNIEEGTAIAEAKSAELLVTENALHLMEILSLKGGLIRMDGEVIAFAIGEALTKDTFCVHIEKAYGNIVGAYQLINQQFVEHEASIYRYVNREDDAGSEGLRKAKLSYYPEILLKKGIVTKIKDIE